MTFHVDYTAVNVDGDGSEFASIKQLSENFEIDFSQHLGGLIAEISQKSGGSINEIPNSFTNGSP